MTVVIDSDIIVTASDGILDFAREGQDLPVPGVDAGRPHTLVRGPGAHASASSPLRRDDWVHNGFVAFSANH
jgi:hypothetical protein